MRTQLLLFQSRQNGHLFSFYRTANQLSSFRGNWNLYACKAFNHKILRLNNVFKNIHDINEKTPLERVWPLESGLGCVLLHLTVLKPWAKELILLDLSYFISKMRIIIPTSWESKENEKPCYKTQCLIMST